MTKTPTKMCSEKVHHRTGSFGFGRMYPCKRKATVERDGQPYCTQHDPERVAREREAQMARWEREREDDRKKREREAKQAAFLREAMQEIANHNKHEARVTCTCYLCVIWTLRAGAEKPEVTP